jgi:type IV pilus assembly protein PilV
MLRPHPLQIKENSGGFTLTEVLIAVVILSVGLLGLFAMTIATTRTSSFSKNLTTATILAQDKIEQIKNMSYANIAAGNFLENYKTIPEYPQFSRNVNINDNNPKPNTKTVVVTTSWTGADQTRTDKHSVTLKIIISR